MIENKVLKGEWNLPGELNTFSGILTFDSLNGSRLEIFGVFGSMFSRNMPLIHGKTTDGWVTLLDTYYKSGHHSNVTSTSISVLTPGIVLMGYRFSNLDEIQFTKVRFTVFNLLEWINYDAIQQEINGNKHLLEYNKPDRIAFDCYSECKGEITFTLEGGYKYPQYQVNLSQHCEVVFRYYQTKPFREILSDIFKLIGFITLCTYEQTYPMKIVFFSDQFKDKFIAENLNQETLQPVTCFYRNSFYSPDYKKREFYEHLVMYESIANTFSQTIAAWFTQSKELEPVFQLLLRSFIDKYNFNTEKFMDIVRAIETFHRMKHNNEIVSKEEIKDIKRIISDTSLSDEQKKLVNEKLNFAYEPTLKERLEEMINLYTISYFSERIKDTSNFIKKAKDSRNYYTHFDENSKEKALRGKELFDLSENLKLILFSAVFKSVGIPENAFNESIRRLIYST
jgi:hypothetical protein